MSLLNVKSGKVNPLFAEFMEKCGVRPPSDLHPTDVFHVTQQSWYKPELSRFDPKGEMPTPEQYGLLKLLGFVDGLIINTPQTFSEALVLGAPIPKIIMKRIQSLQDAASIGCKFDRIALISGRVPMDERFSLSQSGKFFVGDGLPTIERSAFGTEPEAMDYLWQNTPLPEDWPEPDRIVGNSWLDGGIENRPNTESTLCEYFSKRTRKGKYKIIVATDQPHAPDQWYAVRLHMLAMMSHETTVAVVGAPAPVDTPLHQYLASAVRLYEKQHRYWRHLCGEEEVA